MTPRPLPRIPSVTPASRPDRRNGNATGPATDLATGPATGLAGHVAGNLAAGLATGLAAGALLALVFCGTAAAAAKPASAAPAPQPEAAPALPEAAGDPLPRVLARSIQALQEQIAQGSAPAREAQQALLLGVGEELLAADPSTWQDAANARAALVYVLSGGQPAILRRLMALDPAPPVEPALIAGVLAYATGREAEARAALDPVDARALPPSLGAHIALAQARLAVAGDPARASRLLETVRLLAPGTLLEEAALRRQMAVSGGMGDAGAFAFLARQYVRRFRQSAYAGNFLRDFLDQAEALGLAGDAAGLDTLAAIVDGLEAPARVELYLSLARRQLATGSRDLARAAAGRALEIAGATPAEAARARLYTAAADVAGAGAGAALAALRAIDPATLPEEDARLREAAIAVAEQIDAPVAALPANPPPGSTAGEQPASAVLERGRAVLAAADALLGRLP